jgi:hypothetical protein
LLVVVALDHGAIERADQFNACLWVRAVSDEVAETDVMRAALDLRVGQDRLEGLQVAVDVTEDGDAHGRRITCTFRRMRRLGNADCAQCRSKT